MDERRYRQTRRAEAAAATRARILEAARASVERGPVGALRVEEVAREAGVARSTVYLLFGSRAGLFDALARFLRDEAGFDSLIAASRLPDALENLRASQRAAVALYARLPDLARALFTLAAIDPDAVAAVAAMEDGRRPGMERLAHALQAQGYLRDDIELDEAIDILTIITSFQAFDELFRCSGSSADVVADRLIAMAERSVCRPSPGPSPSGRVPAPTARRSRSATR